MVLCAFVRDSDRAIARGRETKSLSLPEEVVRSRMFILACQRYT